MDDPTGDSTLRSIERLIGTLMPTALDMIATIVDEPAGNLDSYNRLLTVAEAESPVLLLAVLRTAAGLAAIAEMSGADVRSLADVSVTPTYLDS